MDSRFCSAPSRRTSILFQYYNGRKPWKNERWGIKKLGHHQSSRSKYLMLRLLRYSLACYSTSFFQALFWMMSFLNYLRRRSFKRTSFSLSRRMISFFSSYKRLLAHSASRFDNFSSHIRSDSLCSASSFMISDSISAIISMVTTLLLPFFIFSLFQRIFSYMSFRRLLLVTAFSCVFINNFSFSAVLAERVLHYSLILASCALVFSIFWAYFSSLRRSKALVCSFRTFRKDIFSAQSVFSSPYKARMAFYFSITSAQSCTKAFSLLRRVISVRISWIFCYCLRAQSRFSWVS